MKNAPVIIVKKKRAHGGGHHGGAWKVAYADFVTAMMAFFLVLWILGQSAATKAGIAGYFHDPGVLDHQYSTGILPGATTGISPEGPPSLKESSGGPAPTDRAALEKKASMLKAMLTSRAEFKGMKDQIQIEMTKEGLRIELIEKSDSLFFDSGSAALKARTITILQAIARELGSLNNDIVIEGHSDSRRYSSNGAYTNFELSADRANAARRVMEEVLPERRVTEIRGYADTRLRYPADPLDARNRRVSIIVTNQLTGDLGKRVAALAASVPPPPSPRRSQAPAGPNSTR
jgi:chemotaxis protein MotB